MFFLKDFETADQWQKKQSLEREIFTLDEALEFSAGFFVPLIED